MGLAVGTGSLQALASGLAHQWALLLPFTAASWLGSEPVAPGTGGCSVCLSCHMDGSKERGVFVLSRELYSFLSIFINNSAHGQGGWGRGDRSREGQQQHWRSGQVEARGELTSPASQLWPSNRARWPQGPCLEECRPGICS